MMCIYLLCLISLIYIYYDLNKKNKHNKLKKYKEKFSNNNIETQLFDSKLEMPIKIYDNFINQDECDKLIKLSEGKFIQSSIYESNKGIIDTKSRSSSNSYFTRGENSLIKKIENKVTNLLNIKLDQIEPLQIVKYEKGQEYKYHYDYFDKNTDQNNNQRTNSFLVYLNDLDEKDGGATHFPLYKFKFYPSKGRAIHWENMDLDKNLNKLSLHAGQPILTDNVKYVLTIWTRENSY